MTSKKPTTVQQKMLAMAGHQDIDQFMREMEVVHKKRETERAQDLNARLSLLEETENSKGKMDVDVEPPGAMDSAPSRVSNHHSMPPMGMPPPPLLYRPPPPPMHLRMPPPPPPRLGMRLPPGPPSGMPRLLRPGPPSMPRIPPPPMQMPMVSSVSNAQMQNQQGNATSQPKTPNVLTAAPQLINRKDKDGKSSSTIEAKPQIRNLAADVTRFLPTSLRVKRDDKRKPSTIPRIIERLPEAQLVQPQQSKTKDDAYMQFMQEMKGLL